MHQLRDPRQLLAQFAARMQVRKSSSLKPFF
jgi:hypothetical protein